MGESGHTSQNGAHTYRKAIARDLGLILGQKAREVDTGRKFSLDFKHRVNGTTRTEDLSEQGEHS